MVRTFEGYETCSALGRFEQAEPVAQPVEECFVVSLTPAYHYNGKRPVFESPYRRLITTRQPPFSGPRGTAPSAWDYLRPSARTPTAQQEL